jgi:hypothetical protein
MPKPHTILFTSERTGKHRAHRLLGDWTLSDLAATFGAMPIWTKRRPKNPTYPYDHPED